MKKIFSTINRYFLLSQAGLREDMAKRIMYSVIEPITKYPDSTALSLAIEGWKDIVKYGTKAVVGELRHSRRNIRDNLYKEAFDLYKQGKYLEALDLAIEDYAKPWQQAYGGPAWGRIASQVKEILLQGQKLEKDPSIQNQKDMVIQLNVFDGLAHNTESVMRNLVDIESKTLSPGYVNVDDVDEEIYDLSASQGSRSSKEYERIRELMDAKELKNFLDVWREIKPEIEGMGSIFFKPYKGRLHDEEISEYKRLTPEQRIKKENNLKIEKASISFKKRIITLFKKFEDKYAKLESDIPKLKKIIEDYKPLFEIPDHSNTLMGDMTENIKETIKEIEKLEHDVLNSIGTAFSVFSDLKYTSLIHKLPYELRDLEEVKRIENLPKFFYEKHFSTMKKIDNFRVNYEDLFDSYRYSVYKQSPDLKRIESFMNELDEILPILDTMKNNFHNLTAI